MRSVLRHSTTRSNPGANGQLSRPLGRFASKRRLRMSLAQVLPALVFAKGIGRNVGDKVVWDVTYLGDKLLVNGTDLSAMTGAR